MVDIGTYECKPLEMVWNCQLWKPREVVWNCDEIMVHMHFHMLCEWLKNMYMACGKECEKNVCVETELHGLRLSWAESLRCGHSCKIYKDAHVWDLRLSWVESLKNGHRYKWKEKESEPCVKCVWLVLRNSGRITNICIIMKWCIERI